MSKNLLKDLDYSVLQQCMHCGMCLPTCPTYDATKQERNSPRGRIALMRSIADDKLEVTETFGDEMYYCLGCLACTTACPAGVDYAHLFEMARAESERVKAIKSVKRDVIRAALIKGLFMHPHWMRLLGRVIWLYENSGAQWLLRTLHLTALVPKRYQDLEAQTPVIKAKFSHQLIAPIEKPVETKYRVAFLTGCVQDLIYSDINRDTVDVLLAHGCEVHTPPVQYCCGSLHGHNGELGAAAELARKQLDMFDVTKFDAIITNAGGCGSHLKHYDRLLEHDPVYAARAVEWSHKLKDIHEWLVQIGLKIPQGEQPAQTVTYHESCHLAHGQKITVQPREMLRAIPGLTLVELPESNWCCGSAGVYNITQPDMSAALLARKMQFIAGTKAPIVATANPGCLLQLVNGARKYGVEIKVVAPISLFAEAFRHGNCSR